MVMEKSFSQPYDAYLCNICKGPHAVLSAHIHSWQKCLCFWVISLARKSSDNKKQTYCHHIMHTFQDVPSKGCNRIVIRFVKNKTFSNHCFISYKPNIWYIQWSKNPKLLKYLFFASPPIYFLFVIVRKSIINVHQFIWTNMQWNITYFLYLIWLQMQTFYPQIMRRCQCHEKSAFPCYIMAECVSIS